MCIGILIYYYVKLTVNHNLKIIISYRIVTYVLIYDIYIIICIQDKYFCYFNLNE